MMFCLFVRCWLVLLRLPLLLMDKRNRLIFKHHLSISKNSSLGKKKKKNVYSNIKEVTDVGLQNS